MMQQLSSILLPERQVFPARSTYLDLYIIDSYRQRLINPESLRDTENGDENNANNCFVELRELRLSITGSDLAGNEALVDINGDLGMSGKVRDTSKFSSNIVAGGHISGVTKRRESTPSALTLFASLTSPTQK